jgi:hypothetical protein
LVPASASLSWAKLFDPKPKRAAAMTPAKIDLFMILLRVVYGLYTENGVWGCFIVLRYKKKSVQRAARIDVWWDERMLT